MIDTSNLQNVDSANPYHKPFYKDRNDGPRLSEDNFEGFGGKKWYNLAKKLCCNFEVRVKEGFCVILATQQVFKGKCCDCLLGKALKDKSA